jgi:hypothetical protein
LEGNAHPDGRRADSEGKKVKSDYFFVFEIPTSKYLPGDLRTEKTMLSAEKLSSSPPLREDSADQESSSFFKDFIS